MTTTQDVPTFADDAQLAMWLDGQGVRGWLADSEHGPDGYEVAVYTVQRATLTQVEAILGYLWAGPMAGEWWPGEGQEAISGHLFIFPLDTTKSGRDDVADAWDAHRHWLVDGSPLRKTDRSGPGTKGTRACAGLGPVLIAWR